MVVQLRRLLDTGDPDDRALVETVDNPGRPMRVIAAVGAGTGLSYHGADRIALRLPILDPSGSADELLSLRQDDTVAQVLMLPIHAQLIWGNDFSASVFDPAVGIPIPKVTTGTLGYFDACFTADELLAVHSLDGDSAWHLVGFEAVIPEHIRRFMHHYVLYGFYDGSPCTEANSAGGSLIWEWARGVDGRPMPAEAGFPMARASTELSPGRSAFRKFVVNYHIDNPDAEQNFVTDAGIRVFATQQLREHDAGSLQFGDPALTMTGTQLPKGKSSVTFECPSSCTERLGEAITIFNTQLHMHAKGIAMQTVQRGKNSSVKGGSNAPVVSQYYDVGFQDQVDRRMVVEPGDSFHTTCVYDTGDREDVKFGSGSDDEMCINFVLYYPATPHLASTGHRCGAGVCGSISTQLHPIETGAEDSALNVIRTWPSVMSCDEETPASSPTLMHNGGLARAPLPGYGYAGLITVLLAAIHFVP